jgi:GlpG protein|tara:strand:+ start:5329 stop:6213 length:885 start_codon:yes stop_codon:yes gene_type:complete
MIKVLEIDIGEDLSLFSKYLWQLGIRHRINEHSGNQLLWVGREEHQQKVLELFEQLKSGELRLAEESNPAGPKFAGRLVALLILYRRLPAVLTLILICLICFPLTIGYEKGESSVLLHWLTFVDFQIRGDLLYSADLTHSVTSGELWRLWTPMFIHFGWMHLIFNLLWVWEIGRRIELLHKAPAILLITAISSLVANLGQYWMSGPTLFGGMSGVVYAYLGYSFVWSRLQPTRSFGLPEGIYIFMLIWLVLGFSGVIDSFGFGSIANGAHLGGLVAGAMMGWAACLLSRRSRLG